MMKINFFRSLGCGLLLAILIGCSPEEVDPVIPPPPVRPELPVDPPTPPLSPDTFRYFVEVADSLELNRGSLAEILGAGPKDPLVALLPDRRIRLDVLHYYTEDPLGNRVVASGTIAYPLDLPFRGVIVGEHFTVTSDADVPSRCKVIFETALALFGYVVVSPDYLGFGASVDLPHPYLDMRSNGQVSVDLLLAAREYMEERERPLENSVYAVGYSQGGYAALAFQKMVEEEYPEEIHLNAVFAGGGPLEPDKMYDQMVAEDYATYSSVVPLIIIGADYGGQLNLDYSRVFLSPLLSSYPEWFISKKYTMGQLQDKLRSHQLTHFMNPDMFTEEMNPEFRKIKEELRRNRLTDWTPQAPIYLVHGKNDQVVPSWNSQDAYDMFRSRGCDVHLEMISGQGHKEAAIPFYLLVLGKLI